MPNVQMTITLQLDFFSDNQMMSTNHTEHIEPAKPDHLEVPPMHRAPKRTMTVPEMIRAGRLSRYGKKKNQQESPKVRDP